MEIKEITEKEKNLVISIVEAFKTGREKNNFSNIQEKWEKNKDAFSSIQSIWEKEKDYFPNIQSYIRLEYDKMEFRIATIGKILERHNFSQVPSDIDPDLLPKIIRRIEEIFPFYENYKNILDLSDFKKVILDYGR